MPNLGVSELVLIFLIILVIFGASKLPGLGRGLGEAIRNFRKGIEGDKGSPPPSLPDKGDTPKEN